MRMIFINHYACISIELRFLARVFHIILYGSCGIRRRIRIFAPDLRLNVIVLWASSRIWSLLLWVCLLINHLWGIHWWSCGLIVGDWVRLRYKWLCNWSLLQYQYNSYHITFVRLMYYFLFSL